MDGLLIIVSVCLFMKMMYNTRIGYKYELFVDHCVCLSFHEDDVQYQNWVQWMVC